MARKISVEIVGDEQSLLRSFQRSAKGAQVFEKDIGRASRGALAASVSFRGMGRSVAFASSYFLGGAGLVYAVKSSIEQAETSAKAHAALSTAIKKVGGDVRTELPAIDRWAASQAKFGVSANTAEVGLGRLVELTGSTSKAMQGYTAALEISKATGKDFNAVSLAVGKALNGQTTALARYIGKLPKGISDQQLLADVFAKYGGQAKANTLATDKLSAELTNVETVIGGALLPTVDKYANELANWLAKSKNQERLQRDVSEAVKDFSSVIHVTAEVVKDVTHALGGFKATLEALLLLKTATWLRGTAAGLGLIGTEAVTARGEVTALRGSLLGLNAIAIAPIVIPIEEKIERTFSSGIKETLGGKAASAYDYVQGFFSGGAVGKNPILALLESGAKNKNVNDPGFLPPKFQKADHSDTRLRRTSVQPTVASANAAAMQNSKTNTGTATPYLSYLLAQAEGTAGTGDDRDILNRMISVLRSRLAKTKNLAARTALLDAINGYEQQIASFDKTAETARTKAHKAEVSQIKKDAAAAKARAAAVKAALDQATQTAFSAIGQLGQGPVATGPAAQFLQQYGGGLNAQGYTSDITQQNNQFAKELRQLRSLRKRGAPKNLLDNLFGQGAAGAQEIAALAGASKGQLKTFIAQYERRQKLVAQAAKMEVTTPYVTVNAKTVTVGASDAKGRPAANKFGRTGTSSRRK